MTKYVLKRLLRGFLSLFVVVAIVMILIYSCIDRNQIFKTDSLYSRQAGNEKEVYKMKQWEKYGYIDYIHFEDDFLKELRDEGRITDSENKQIRIGLGPTPDKDSKKTTTWINYFKEKYEKEGYTFVRIDGKGTKGKKRYNYKRGDAPEIFVYKDIPLANRMSDYFLGLLEFDNIHYVEEDIENRGLSFTLKDPAYGGDTFAPAIMGNGTRHKYLLYFDSTFPYIHQNFVNVNLGTSFSVNKNIDVFTTMTEAQGSLRKTMVHYPTGLSEMSADNIHTATYSAGSLASGTAVKLDRYTDDYTSVELNKNGLSRVGYSFVIGIISVILAYFLAIPLGVLMALQKDKLIDKLGTLYIVFIIAVPSLAYIFLFKSIGGKLGLQTTFDVVNPTWLMYVLPIVSLALPSIANLMKWLRRYMIDQMNSDYVKFARSGGLSEGEIFRKHILKNALIPIVHGIPGSILGALVGAIITERVYVGPGAGNLLTTAINAYDNSVIVGLTLFYGLLTVVSIILGDVLMSMVDPRINFTSKGR